MVSERGEVSGALRAREALDSYRSLDPEAKIAFFNLLVEEFSPDPEAAWRAAVHYRSVPTQDNLIRLQQAVEPPRQELFRRLNMASGGTAVLVGMHSKLLEGLPGHPQWRGIDSDFVHLLRSWFNRGFLGLQRIDWRTSASILEKLIEYEAVHAIDGWRDLRRRLEADRRCYAFFHPALPEEPLIFIEVALTHGMSATVQPLLDPDSPVSDPRSADCAIFYSITNCQQGLRGVSFGNLLIKQVAEDLGRELPRVKTFATISPIPRFRTWLASVAASLDPQDELSTLATRMAALDQPRWFEDEALSAKLRGRLEPLCAYYLLHCKEGQEPLDPVARFHLVNGARLERLNWLGDISATGMRQSAAMMANYVYRLAEVERNHEAYMRNGSIVASRGLQQLAKQSLMVHGSKLQADGTGIAPGQAVVARATPAP